jgi:hypothetical protein
LQRRWERRQPLLLCRLLLLRKAVDRRCGGVRQLAGLAAAAGGCSCSAGSQIVLCGLAWAAVLLCCYCVVMLLAAAAAESGKCSKSGVAVLARVSLLESLVAKACCRFGRESAVQWHGRAGRAEGIGVEGS